MRRCIACFLLVCATAEQLRVIITNTDVTLYATGERATVLDASGHQADVVLSDNFTVHQPTSDEEYLLYCRVPQPISLVEAEERRRNIVAEIETEKLMVEVFSEMMAVSACVKGKHETPDVGTSEYIFCPKGNISRKTLVEEPASLTLQIGMFSPAVTKLRWNEKLQGLEMWYPNGAACPQKVDATPTVPHPTSEETEGTESKAMELLSTRIVLRCMEKTRLHVMWAVNYIPSECIYQIEMGVQSVCRQMQKYQEADLNYIVCNEM